jgi:outer membrane protein OmpA-like peptidoglycan-associated protein
MGMSRGGTVLRALAVALLLFSVVSPSSAVAAKQDDKCHGTTGAVIGAVAGVMLGIALAGDKKKSRLALAIVAAGLGALIGRSIDQRRCRLKKIAKTYKLDLQVSEIALADVSNIDAEANGTALRTSTNSGKAADVNQPKPDSSAGLVVTLRDDGRQFASGSDQLTLDAEKYFGEIADTYVAQEQEKALGEHPTEEQKRAVEALRQRIILLVGHTDDVGDSAGNAALSERRARTVAALFRSHGIPDGNLFYQGAGETLPIADNRTEEGRSHNRRVEIIDLADTSALAAFLDRRLPRIEHYRPVETAIAESKPPPLASPPAVSASSHPGPTAPVRQRQARMSAPLPPPRGPSSAPPPRVLAGDELDFGGQPADRLVAADIGPLVRSRGLSAIFIPSAHAATLESSGISSCARDRPRYAYAVKSLSTGTPLPYSTGDFMRGLYDTSWAGAAGQHLVALTHVSVLRDGGMPAARPTLMVFRDYARHPSRGAKPTFALQPQVNVYRGERGTLYRVFASAAHNLRCIDMVLPPQGGFAAPASTLAYVRGGAQYRAHWEAKVAGH